MHWYRSVLMVWWWWLAFLCHLSCQPMVKCGCADFTACKSGRFCGFFLRMWWVKWGCGCSSEQEGQHPLTGQRAANGESPGVSTKVNDRWQQGSPVHRLQHVLPMGVAPFAFRYQANGATPCQYIDTTRKAFDCTTTLLLTVFIEWNFAADFCPLLLKLSERRQI